MKTLNGKKHKNNTLDKNTSPTKSRQTHLHAIQVLWYSVVTRMSLNPTHRLGKGAGHGLMATGRTHTTRKNENRYIERRRRNRKNKIKLSSITFSYCSYFNQLWIALLICF